MTQYYVSPTGTGNGLAVGTPTSLETLSAWTLAAGDDIEMAAGTYPAFSKTNIRHEYDVVNGNQSTKDVGFYLKDQNGTSGNPITFTANGVVKIAGTTKDEFEFGLYMENCDYITLDGLGMDGSNGLGFPGDNSPNHVINRFGLVYLCDHFTYKNSTVHRSNQGRSFLIHTSDYAYLTNMDMRYCGFSDHFQDADGIAHTAPADNSAQGDMLTWDWTSKYGLLTNSFIGAGGHIALALHGEYNIARNNTLNGAYPPALFGVWNVQPDHPNYAAKQYLNGKRFGNRTISFRSGTSQYTGRNVFENNTIEDSGMPEDTGGGQGRIAGTGSIYRFNVVETTDGERGPGIAGTNGSSNNDVYNCEVYNNEWKNLLPARGYGSGGKGYMRISAFTNGECAWNRCYNNAFGPFDLASKTPTNGIGVIVEIIAYNSSTIASTHPTYGTHPLNPTFGSAGVGPGFWCGNSFFHNTFAQSNTELEAWVPSADGFSGRNAGTVAQVQARTDGTQNYIYGNQGNAYGASVGSPHAYVTQTGSGTGTTFDVSTTSPFVAPNLYLQMTAHGLLGDQVTIDGQTRRITSINEAASEITLDSSINWANGDAIVLTAALLPDGSIATGVGPGTTEKTYYVAPEGVGAQDGTTAQNAVNISGINGLTLNPNDTVRFLAGTYYNRGIVLNGLMGADDSNRILFVADSGEGTVTLKGTGRNAITTGLSLTDCSWLTFRGIDMDGSPTSGNYFPNYTIKHHAAWTNCTGIIAEDFTAYKCNGWGGWSINSGSTLCTTRRCSFGIVGTPDEYTDDTPGFLESGDPANIDNGDYYVTASGSSDNLLEDFFLTGAGHGPFGMYGDRNIMRRGTVDCYFDPPYLYPDQWPAGHPYQQNSFLAGTQKGSRGGTTRGNYDYTGRNLLEDVVMENFAHAVDSTQALRAVGYRVIIRYCTFDNFVGCEQAISMAATGSSNRWPGEMQMYNNEFTNIGTGMNRRIIDIWTYQDPNKVGGYNRFFNNAIENYTGSGMFGLIRHEGYATDPYPFYPAPLTDSWANNEIAHNSMNFALTAKTIIGPSNTSRTISAAETERPNNVYGNIGSTFKSATGGMHVTTITSATNTNQTTFTVANGVPFVAGFNHPDVDNDSVTVNGTTRQIVSLTLTGSSTWTMVLDGNVSWTQGDGISPSRMVSAGNVTTGLPGGEAAFAFSSSPVALNVTATSADIKFTPNQAGNYAIIVDTPASPSTEPSETDFNTTYDAIGVTTAFGQVTRAASGLTASTTYKFWVEIDNQPGTDRVVSSVEITTLGAGAAGGGQTGYLQATSGDYLVTIDLEDTNVSVTNQGSYTYSDVTDVNADTGTAVRAQPDDPNTSITPANALTQSPYLEMPVIFDQTGTHYVWYRNRGVSSGGADTSEWAGGSPQNGTHFSDQANGSGTSATADVVELSPSEGDGIVIVLFHDWASGRTVDTDLTGDGYTLVIDPTTDGQAAAQSPEMEDWLVYAWEKEATASESDVTVTWTGGGTSNYIMTFLFPGDYNGGTIIDQTANDWFIYADDEDQSPGLTPTVSESIMFCLFMTNQDIATTVTPPTGFTSIRYLYWDARTYGEAFKPLHSTSSTGAQTWGNYGRVAYNRHISFNVAMPGSGTVSNGGVHTALDGTIPTSAQNQTFTVGDGTYQWDHNSKTVSVGTTGVHTLRTYMYKNDGHIDRLLLTTNSGYTPTGDGPVASTHQVGAAPVLSNGVVGDLKATSVDLSIDTDTSTGTVYVYVYRSAVEPPVADIKAGTGAIHYDSISPSPFPSTVTFDDFGATSPATLLEDTDQYYAFFLHNNGTASPLSEGDSNVVRVGPFKTADVTAPIINLSGAVIAGENSAIFQFYTDEGKGTAYAIVKATDSAPSIANDIIVGASAVATGQKTITSSGANNITVPGLTPGSTGWGWVVHVDLEGNESNILAMGTFDLSEQQGYPQLPAFKVKRDPFDNSLEFGLDGVARSMNLLEEKAYRFTITHPHVTSDEFAILQSFYNDKQGLTFPLDYRGDQYDCVFAVNYDINEKSPTYYEVKVSLIGLKR